MNRQQRRVAEQERKREARRIWPAGYCVVPAELKGEWFTIKGIQRLGSGAIVRECEPGKETRWLGQ